ncbi:MAG: flagellar hook-length control protein FliK [Pseudomonadota bacterium]
MDNNIQPDKLITNETLKAENAIQKTATKEPIPVGQLLQDTIKNLSREGLNSINVAKAVQLLKGLFPSEFTQAQIQDRQAQIDNPIVKTAIFTPISDATKDAWFNGQIVHAKVLKTQIDGQATLIIDKQSIEVKVTSDGQLKLEAGQNLALSVEKTGFEKTTLKEFFNQEPTASKEAATTNKDSAVNKTASDNKELLVSKEASTNKEPVASRDLISNKEPFVNKEPSASNEPSANKEPSTNKELRFILSSTPEQSTKLIQLIQTMVTKQQAMPPLLAALDSVVQQSNLDKLPAPVVKAIQQLLNQFSSAQQLSLSEGLKSAISNSGIFLENHVQINKTNSIDLNSLIPLLKTINSTADNNQVVAKIIGQLETASQKLSTKIDLNITIPSEVINLFNKNLLNSTNTLLDLKEFQNVNQMPDKSLQINKQPVSINHFFAQLKSIDQSIEQKNSNLFLSENSKQITPQQILTNNYPKAYIQSINQMLGLVSQQFNENNQALLNNNNRSFAQSQAKQFSQQMQQINQTISQAISNSNPQTIVNPQINNDLKLNLQRLLTILQNLTTPEHSQTISNQSKLNSSLLQHFSHHEAELNRQALPTRNKHAQVAMAQQNQLLQIANPIIFQHTLIEQLEGVMSRIVATQAAIREQPDSNINMALEIPFKFQDKSQVLQLKFTSEDKHENKSKGKIWTANLAFELQSLGAIRIYLILDDKDISMQFWTEKKSTQKIFAENFSQLRDRLKIAGYHIKEMIVSLGIPEQAKDEIKKTKKGLIDEQV